MSRYRFELATAAADAELQAILAATPMDGQVAVAFRRDSGFFAAAAVEGPFHQVIVGRDQQTGRIVGFGSRSIRLRYVNGRPAPIGYLSSLRVLPQYRNIGLVARGYAFLRELHGDGRTPLYLTTIAEGNDQALSILTSGRAGLPRYYEAGRFFTVVLSPTPRKSRQRRARGIEVRAARADDVPTMIEFLQRHGPSRQFFPVYEAADFSGAGATFRGLDLSDMGLVFRDGHLAGMLAAWDQRAFRQTVVQRYRGPLRWLHPFYNVTAWLRGLPHLPRAGEAFSFLTGATPVVKDDDDDVLAALIDYQTNFRVRAARPYLLLGLHEQDPLLAVAQTRQVTAYVTRLYHVCWDEGEPFRAGLDLRPPYLELGCL